MELFVGIALALFFCSAATLFGMDRERVFYPAVLIAVASYYVAFAVGDGRTEVLLSEFAIAVLFMGLAVTGFRRNVWLAVSGLAGHGVMDSFHHALVQNNGVPLAWPGFCMTFDLTAALLVACILVFRSSARFSRRELVLVRFLVRLMQS